MRRFSLCRLVYAVSCLVRSAILLKFHVVAEQFIQFSPKQFGCNQPVMLYNVNSDGLAKVFIEMWTDDASSHTTTVTYLGCISCSYSSW